MSRLWSPCGPIQRLDAVLRDDLVFFLEAFQSFLVVAEDVRRSDVVTSGRTGLKLLETTLTATRLLVGLILIFTFWPSAFRNWKSRSIEKRPRCPRTSLETSD